MLKRQQSMESLARSRGQTIDRLTGENIRLRAEVEELTRALEKIAERYTLPWDGTTGQYLVEIENCARAALAKAKGDK